MADPFEGVSPDGTIRTGVRRDLVPDAFWWRVEDSDNRGWEQVATEGQGPDRVVVPDAATPGQYMLCTANVVDEACALLTVTG